MDKYKDIGICTENSMLLQWLQEVMALVTDNPEMLNTVYREISEQIGLESAIKMYLLFKGTQVCFPVRLFNPECVKKKIVEEYNGKNIQILAKKYDYSEKTIRRIIKKSISERGGI